MSGMEKGEKDMTATPLNTHGYLMPRGKHQGQPITRVPLQYLRWMVNEKHDDSALAQAELIRRGFVMPDMEISGHAIDKASLRCRKIWHETAKSPEEGLHAWLMRVSKEAYLRGEILVDAHPDPEGRNFLKGYLGMKFAFAQGEEFPVLKTIMPLKGSQS